MRRIRGNESLFPGQRLLALRISSSPHSSIESKASLGALRKRITRSSDDALHAHRTLIALPSHTRARVAAKSLAGGPRPKAVPDALRAVQDPSGGPLAKGRSRGGYRTEIVSPANKQYKGRKSLAGVPIVPRSRLEACGVPDGCKKNNRPKAVGKF